MISVGLSLKPKRIGEHLSKIAAIASVKLVALPLLALAIGMLVTRDSSTLRILVLEAGVPSMMFTLVFGMRFKLDIDLIASAILVTTVGAIVTIPLLQLLV
jgi:predicted permease